MADATALGSAAVRARSTLASARRETRCERAAQLLAARQESGHPGRQPRARGRRRRRAGVRGRAAGRGRVFRAAPAHGRLSFPADHPLSGQAVPLWAPEIAERLAEFDVLLVAGMDLLREYVYHGPEPAIPRTLQIVHLDENGYQIGKNFPVEVGAAGRRQERAGRAGRTAGRA